MIGHLQSNKIKKALHIFDVIQTVESLKQSEKINKHAAELKKEQRIFCQVNIGNDPNKSGFKKNEIFNYIKKINTLPHISIEGIMTILPFNLDEKKIQRYYNETRILRDVIEKTINKELELSMGMSADYKIAIKCGASVIRVGTNLFGERN